MDIRHNYGVTRAVALSRTGLQPNVIFFPTDAKGIVFNGREYGYEALSALWRLKGSVANYNALPSSGQSVYDVWNCLAAAGNHDAGYYQWIPAFNVGGSHILVLKQPYVFTDGSTSSYGIIDSTTDLKVKWCDANGTIYYSGNDPYYLCMGGDDTLYTTTDPDEADILVGTALTEWKQVGLPDITGLATQQQLAATINALPGNGLELTDGALDVNIGQGIEIINDSLTVYAGDGLGFDDDYLQVETAGYVGIDGNGCVDLKSTIFCSQSDIAECLAIV